jgi:hypothetical protein
MERMSLGEVAFVAAMMNHYEGITVGRWREYWQKGDAGKLDNADWDAAAAAVRNEIDLQSREQINPVA